MLEDKFRKYTIKNRISNLKVKLNESDYQAIKYAEGLITELEYQPTKQLRQQYRNEINQLEEELSTLS